MAVKATWTKDAMLLKSDFLRLRARGSAPLSIGAPGTGKSFFCHSFAAGQGLSLGDGFRQANITKSTDPRILVGKNIFVENGGDHPKFRWVDGDLTVCIRKGGMFLADELNRGAGELQNRFFSVTETGYRYLSLFEKGNEIVEIPKEFMLMATQNPVSGMFYNQPLDKALAERFIHIEIDKPLCNEEGLAEQILPKAQHGTLGGQMVSVAQDSRKSNQPIYMSTRALSQVLGLCAEGFEPMQALKYGWMNRLESEDREAAKQIITAHFSAYFQKTGQSFDEMVRF